MLWNVDSFISVNSDVITVELVYKGDIGTLETVL